LASPRATAPAEPPSDASTGPLPARLVVGRTPSVKETGFADGWLYWLEQRPAEGGRTTLLRRPAHRSEAPATELTPGRWNLRSRVHAYGGGSWCSAGGLVIVIDDGDRCLWALDPQRPDSPRRLTVPGERAFADGLIDLRRQRWIGVMEAEGRDQLVSVPLAGGEPQLLHQPADFCGYAALSPDGRQLAWIAWQQPHMPWERSQLWLAELEEGGALQHCRCLAGAGDQAVSLFQPLWIGPEELVVADDSSGWWNLRRLHTGSGQWVTLLPMEAEFAMPQWVYGMRTAAWDGERLVAAACREGVWQLGEVSLDPAQLGTATAWRPLAQPFDDLACLSAADGTLACVASSPITVSGLLQLELASGQWRHTPVSELPLPEAAISPPEALWFAGHGGAPTHAWYYPPLGGANAGSPLLVKGHSGPTGMARRGLQLAIQFWTSRGWGVVDVNYGGSTGFGRAYRERLQGLWGVADVADCAAAAEALVAAGRASPERVAIEGGSAGGFTALAALCFTNTFRAAACRYAVSDPAALAQHDHRFEARYLDGLIGPWPAAAATYEARSPLLHAGQIRCPVILFQGLDDTVVPPEQTEHMAAALAARDIPVEVHRFAGEGHGFRDGSVQVRVLEASEAFFRHHFQLAPA
jgi:dipeptidyl aminopeptidase/acylaminoacyl peptidase